MPYGPQDLSGGGVDDNLTWTLLEEVTGEYITTDQVRLRLRMELNGVARTNRFNSHGAPIYLVHSSHKVEVEPMQSPFESPPPIDVEPEIRTGG